MDRIELIPKDVRGGGNITQPHDNLISDENVSFYNSYLQRYNGSSDSFYLPYYRVISYSSNRELVWTPPRVIDDVDSVNVFVNLIFRDTGRSDAGCPVHLKLLDSDNEVLWSGDDYIEINGVTFTVPLPDNLPDVCYWRVDLSHSGTVQMHDTRKMVVGSITDFDAFATEDIIQTGETSYLIGKVTGLSSEGNVFGVPGQLVNFYEQWTPGLRVSAPIVQSGDTVDIKAQLIDTVDGSLVRESGHTVNVYWDDAPVPVPTTLDVIVDKTVLSYADSDAAHLTLTLYDQFSNPLAGEYIEFTVDGEFEYRFLTNSDGQVVLNHQSTGVGDTVLGFECGSVSESITIEDCIYFHDMTSADSHWTIPENANASYSSDGMKFSGAGFCDAYLEVPLTKPYSVEFDLTEWSGSPNFLHYFWDSTKTTRHINTGYNNSKTSFDVYPNANNSFDGGIPQGSHIKIEIGNDVCKLYVDDTLKLTKSYTMPSSSILGLAKSGSCPITRKNIKIKPL